MSCRLEPAIWSCDTGQQIPCFGRCPFAHNMDVPISKKYTVNHAYMSLSTYYLEYGRHVARLHRRRRRAYVPTSNTAGHDNHEKISSWVFLCGPSGCWSSAINTTYLPTVDCLNLNLEYWPSVIFVQISLCSVYTANNSGQYSPALPCPRLVQFGAKLNTLKQLKKCHGAMSFAIVKQWWSHLQVFYHFWHYLDENAINSCEICKRWRVICWSGYTWVTKLGFLITHAFVFVSTSECIMQWSQVVVAHY